MGAKIYPLFLFLTLVFISKCDDVAQKNSPKLPVQQSKNFQNKINGNKINPQNGPVSACGIRSNITVPNIALKAGEASKI
jgi:hypothetical protein